MSDIKVKKTRSKRKVTSIDVLRVTNPFNPREFVRESIAWKSSKTLDNYFPPVTAQPVIISINGKIITQDKFGVTYLDSTDNVVICPVPSGGGGSKGILSIVALIAFSIVTAGAGAAFAGAALGTDAIGFAAAYGATGVGIANGIVTLAGSMLVHAIFAPSAPPRNNSATTSPTYGIDGAKNTSLEGIPVSVCYGTFRQGGNVLGLYVDNDGDTQILYMLLSAGEGQIAGISGIEINDNSITDYANVETQIRLGLPNQLPIPWFQSAIVPQNKGTRLSTDYTYHTTTSVVDQLRIDVVAPSGLFQYDANSGGSNPAYVDLDIGYRSVGSPTWIAFAGTNQIVSYLSVTGTLNVPIGATINPNDGIAYTFDGAQYTPIVQTWTWRDNSNNLVTDKTTLDYLLQNPPQTAYSYSGGDNGGYGIANPTASVPVYGLTTRLESSSRTALRKSFSTGRLNSDHYEVRIRRLTDRSLNATLVDDVVLSDINEIQLEALSYPNTALLGIKIRLNDQINGTPRVTFMNGGRMIQTYGRPLASSTKDQWYAAASTNPAWIVWDILTNKRFGGAISTARLDFAAFNTWANYCTSAGLTFNGIIDTEMNVWDATQLVLRVGHAQLVNIGTRYTIVVEKAAAAVMMFSVANMIEGSYKETWLSTADRANEVDVTFFDKTDKYKQRTVKVYDPAAIASGQKQRSSQVTLYGVVDYATAYKEGQFLLNLNRYILKTVNFSAPMEAVACTVGDLVYIQTDMTDWAQAGRFAAGSTTSVAQLDRPVSMTTGLQYKLLALHDSVRRASGSVYSVVGASVFITGFDGSTSVKRIQVGGKDLRVASTFTQADTLTGIIVDDASGLSAGMTYVLFDTDVIDEYDVVNTGTTSTAITLQSPMLLAPAQFANWMFGESAKVKKPFRIKSINGTHEYHRDITAIQYDASVYDFTRYGSNMGPVITTPNAVISDVRDLSVYEETYVAGSAIATKVVASWRAPISGFYAGGDVYVKRNSGAMVKYGTAKNETSLTIDAAKGDVLQVKVVALDLFGKQSKIDQATTITYTVIGQITNLNVGSVSGAGFYWSGRECKLTWRYNATTHSYEFGSEPNGADSGSLDPHFKDYEIRVYDQMHTTLRRTEYVSSNSYIYSYDKNFADGLTRHVVFEIRQRDIFNNLGVAALIDAYNPPPTITGATVNPSFETAQVNYTHSNDPDYTGARMWLSLYATDVNGDIADPKMASFLVYDGPDVSVLLSNLMFNAPYFLRIAGTDAFGPTELIPTNVITFNTTNLNVNAIAAGVLKDSQLIPALQTRINLVDGPASMTNSVAAQVLAETNARAAAVLAEAVARGTAVTNLQSSVQTTTDSLSSQINAVSAVTNSNVAAVQTETTARTTADTALGTRIDTVVASVGTANASVVSEQSARASADSALGTRIDSVNASLGTTNANVTSESTARVTADTALGTRIDSTNASVGTTNANVTSETNARVSADNAIGSRVDSVSASLGTTNANVTTEINARASADGALGSRIDTLTSTVGSNTTSIQTTQSTVNGLSGQYSVKIDNNGYVSGFGLSSTATNAAPSSEFIVRADKFAIITPGYPNSHPFTVGTVNGATRTIIDTAMIGDATINSAKIGDLQVNSAKIADLTVGTNKITGNAVSSIDIFNNCANGQPFNVALDSAVIMTISWYAIFNAPTDGTMYDGSVTMGINGVGTQSTQINNYHYSGTMSLGFYLPAGNYSVYLAANNGSQFSPAPNVSILKVKK